MSKKRTRDLSNDTTEVEMQVNSKTPQKCEPTHSKILQNFAPVRILFNKLPINIK